MRRITVIGMIILGLVALPLMAAAKSDKTPDKVGICHIPEEGGEPHGIVISKKALSAHEAHGDLLGNCPDLTALPPVNTAPVADIDVLEDSFCYFLGCSLFLDGTGSFDDEGDSLSYSWTVTNSAGDETWSEDSEFFFKGPSDVYTVELTVFDGEFYDTDVTTFPPPTTP